MSLQQCRVLDNLPSITALLYHQSVSLLNLSCCEFDGRKPKEMRKMGFYLVESGSHFGLLFKELLEREFPVFESFGAKLGIEVALLSIMVVVEVGGL
jgi:hypothetical protein